MTGKPAQVDAQTGAEGTLGSINQTLDDLSKYELGSKAAEEFK